MLELFKIKHREPLIVWFAILLHLLWAVDMFLDPDQSGFATAPYAIKLAFGWASPFLPPMLLFLGCMLAFVGMAISHQRACILLMLPQQTLLFISAIGAIKAIILGHFADGVERSRMFIATDQEPAILLWFLYTVAIIQIARARE